MLTGRLGMLPSARSAEVDAKGGDQEAPPRCSSRCTAAAPDIEAKASPTRIAMIVLVRHALRYSFDMGRAGRQGRRGDRKAVLPADLVR